ncbi:hypothetical protein [Kutzneria buriramensis]|uniref:Uncharacterized protein n=1 Tax=Kutzneria buriramensis TaxID=1045776 RepID=A0A3E0G697_9PSEU|nr:hypothetical protein [Kutzneria buriramensis]REH17999.1 hypothetical protein BCF44_13931 [Kutzneria buriramensis]
MDVTTSASAGPTNQFVLPANKSVILRACAAALGGNGTEVGHDCQTRAAGQKFLHLRLTEPRVPAHHRWPSILDLAAALTTIDVSWAIHNRPATDPGKSLAVPRFAARHRSGDDYLVLQLLPVEC